MRELEESVHNRRDVQAKRLAGRIIIGITGMPGSGKDTVREIVSELGYPLIVMGDEVRAEAGRRNLKPTPENLGKVMLQIRAEEGPEVLAKRCIPKIKVSASSVVIVDGVRSMHEVREFRREFPNFKIVAIHASPKMRFHRLLKRNRSDDPKDWETFIERDQRELSVGIGEVIASADYMVVNEGTKSQLRIELRQLLEGGFRNERNW
jgi:dephospho-CoA kinase